VPKGPLGDRRFLLAGSLPIPFAVPRTLGHHFPRIRPREIRLRNWHRRLRPRIPKAAQLPSSVRPFSVDAWTVPAYALGDIFHPSSTGMPQIFHRSTNTLSRVSIFGGVFLAGGALWLLLEFTRSAWVTQAGIARDQPVPFSHVHHVSGLGIDCRYCHTSVETSAFAGIPPTKTCMNCHSQIWKDSSTLEPVRASYRNDTSIEWVRVHDLPDFVYFNHSAHVNKGIGCSTCHGRVDQMPLVYQRSSLLMEWCLECHREPERFVRPKAEVFNMAYATPSNQKELGKTLVREYGIHPRTSCSTCHR